MCSWGHTLVAVGGGGGWTWLVVGGRGPRIDWGGSGAVGSVGSLADMVAGGQLEQFHNFPGRQLSQNLFAFTQAQLLQEPDLLHLQHAILSSHAGRMPTVSKIFIQLGSFDSQLA